MVRKKAEATSVSPLTWEEMSSRLSSMKKQLSRELMWGDDPSLELVLLPLDIPTLDNAINGGFMFGRFHLFYGDEMSGKTTLSLLVIKKAQEAGLSTCFVDVEKTFDPQWATAIGVDISKLLVYRPNTSEEAMDICMTMITNNVGVLVIDSLAAIATQAELDADSEKKFMGESARAVGSLIKRMNAELKQTLVVYINQLRVDIATMFGNPETLPGGKAQRFHSSMRLRIRRGAWIEEGTGKEKKHIGYKLRIINEKDKHGTPFKEAEVPFFFTGKIDEDAALFSTGVLLDVITQKGPYYVFNDVQVMGRAGFIDKLKADPEFRQLLQDTVESIPEVE